MSSKISKEQQLFHSLVKYDTPYLVSTTVNNKKALEELSQDTQKANNILRSIFYKNKNASNTSEETEDFSLKDALNKILPPKRIIMNGQLWVQYRHREFRDVPVCRLCVVPGDLEAGE